jgi:hypothetical protein
MTNLFPAFESRIPYKKGEQEIYKGRGIDSTVITEAERYLTVDYANKLEPGEYQLSGNLGWGSTALIQRFPLLWGTIKYHCCSQT